jgi:hypothetical protein
MLTAVRTDQAQLLVLLRLQLHKEPARAATPVAASLQELQCLFIAACIGLSWLRLLLTPAFPQRASTCCC